MRLMIALVLLPAALGIAVATAPPSQAACTWTTETYIQNGVLKTRSVRTCSPESPPGNEARPTDVGPPPVGVGACFGLAAQLRVDADEFCGAEDDSPAAPVLTPGSVARALRRVPLPPSELIIQPPDGRTLVNFDTNFYTEERTLFRAVRLLGQRVELRIVADSYTWHFGDGQSVTTSEPGAPYPRLEVTHSYLRTGRFGPSLDTTYVADFRVGGGAWQPVPGSVTIAGPTLSLRAVEATPVLVGYDG